MGVCCSIDNPVTSSSPHESRARNRSVGQSSPSRSRSERRPKSQETEDAHHKLETVDRRLAETKQLLNIKVRNILMFGIE